jgi:hypothetical protein
MNTAAKLGAFALGLVTVFGGAYGAGHLAGHGCRFAPGTSAHGTAPGGHGGHAGTGTAGPAPEHLPGGLLVADRGYRLTPVPTAATEFAFRITGPDGNPVTAFDVTHDKRMHLIVARRDLSGFRHVHPELAADGTWRVAAPFDAPGTWRAYADFTPAGGKPMTLGVDVSVPGMFVPRPLPAPSPVDTIDGYTVNLDGAFEAGRTSKLTLSVARNGAPVTDLQPYLGAYGHLVALRDGDLAYLHVHPEGAPGDGTTRPGPRVPFSVEVPSAGTYRLFLDFQHAGVVRTAAFTVTAGPATAPISAAAPPSPTADCGHGSPGHGH